MLMNKSRATVYNKNTRPIKDDGNKRIRFIGTNALALTYRHGRCGVKAAIVFVVFVGRR